MRKFHDISQHTPEWDVLRFGKFGASTAKDLFAGKSTDSYKKLIYRIAYEIITGESPERFSSAYMNRGVELEPKAREDYELLTFTKVSNGGYFVLDKFTGCSPDGLIGEDGMVQIKCPAYNTHIDYLLKGVVPNDYLPQIQMELWVSGRKWSDFFSWHPHLKPFLIRVERDEKLIKKLQAEVKLATKEVKKLLPLLK